MGDIIDTSKWWDKQPPRNPPPEPPDMETRVTRLESAIEHVHTDLRDIKQDVRDLRGEMNGMRGDARVDFRLLFGALITIAIGLAGLMARGFGWI